ISASIAGRTKTPAASNYLKRILQSPSSDNRQLIAACRAAGNQPDVDASALLPLLQHKNSHIAQEACAALQTKTLSAAELGQVRSAAEQMPVMLQAATARLLHKQGDTLRTAEWLQKIEHTSDVYQRLALIRTLGVSGKSAEICLSAAAQKQDILEANAYTEAFIESHGRTDFPRSIHYSTSLLQLIQRNDIGITALCAAELRNVLLTQEEKAKLNEALIQSLQTLQLPKEVETANEIIKTLNVWGISPREEIKPTFNHPIDWQLVKSIPRRQRANIITSKGTIQLELHVEDAPGSVAAFVTLCREGFYNGKSFHRVVPNFVIQGGCPRGDCIGGTDYTLRSEFRLHDYSTGAVGLASAGPDTESCQWFITHLPTPHLEGRYTIFAHVMEGMEVVDLIEIGDHIERVELL
ncbi:MAG: peptidylprolyl isomerase, partial [Flavobacteriales bacterium]